MNLFKRKRKSESSDETFVRLMQIATEDKEVKQRLISILSLDKQKRNFLLNKWLEELRFQKASEDFISAISYLLDDTTAGEAMKFLNEYKK